MLRECIEAAGNDQLIAEILYRRGIDSPEKVRAFLYEDRYRPFNPVGFKGAKEAIELILSKAEDGAKVCIYGDYDVDGITSTVLLVEALRPLMGEVIYHIPHRFTEGYGMDLGVVERLSREGVDLIITCDCGISNYDEVERGRELGMDIIVTDHHTLPEVLPPANVILNPKQYGEDHPLYYLPGVGVAYMLAIALYEAMGEALPEGRWLDLLALGIVADVVPILRECRYLLKKGLPYLLNPERVGLDALYNVISSGGTGIVDEEDIGFQIAPRINAAGRMASPNLPAELLLEENSNKASQMARELDRLNRDRKALQNHIFENACKIVERDQLDRGILVLYDPIWHEGVLGIVAGKLSDTYKRPAICLALKSDGLTVTGSARSVANISIYNLLAQCEDYLERFGGHSQAAGLSLSLENVEGFTHYIQSLLPIEEGVQESLLDIDVEIDISHVDDSLLHRIEKMAPFGHGFPKPVFRSEDVKVLSKRPIGKNHQRLIFSRGESKLNSIWWWASSNIDENLDRVDIVYTLGRDNRGLSLTIQELEDSKGKAETPSSTPDIVLRDLRGRAIEEILGKYSGGIVYYEGLQRPSYETVNRYEIVRAETLVLLSIPPAPAIFRELVILSGATEVVLGYRDEGRESINNFLRLFQGMLKHAAINRSGIISMEALSTNLGIPEELAEVCLMYLRNRGVIDYTWDEGDDITIYRGSEAKVDRRTERILRESFQEMEAFKSYMCQWNIKAMHNIITGA